MRRLLHAVPRADRQVLPTQALQRLLEHVSKHLDHGAQRGEQRTWDMEGRGTVRGMKVRGVVAHASERRCRFTFGLNDTRVLLVKRMERDPMPTKDSGCASNKNHCNHTLTDCAGL